MIRANSVGILPLILLLCHLHEKIVIDVVIAVLALVILLLLGRDSIRSGVVVGCKRSRTWAFTLHIRLLTSMNGRILSVEHQ